MPHVIAFGIAECDEHQKLKKEMEDVGVNNTKLTGTQSPQVIARQKTDSIGVEKIPLGSVLGLPGERLFSGKPRIAANRKSLNHYKWDELIDKRIALTAIREGE